MVAKRALVVDDSRSARAFLTRVLERYELAVDGVESAEAAIEYLIHQRPDVIFMDHLMPGMDGFQAVQAIKNNPHTATIPIMMYTSQEGELYLSQARALGAIGVLPKQIRHADVSKALEQLNLVSELKPESDIATIQVSALPESRRADPVVQPVAQPVVQPVVQRQGMELHRFMAEQMEVTADRIVSDIKLLLQDAIPPAVDTDLAPLRPRDGGTQSVPWLVAALLLAVAVGLGLQWYHAVTARAALRVQLADTRSQLTDAQRALAAMRPGAQARMVAAIAPATQARSASKPSLVDVVPFGDTPLAGERLDRVQNLLSRLTTQGFRGVVLIRSFPGRFCLSSSGDGYVVAGDIAYSHCDLVGNPRDDSSSSGLRQSVAFANMIAAARNTANGAFDIQVTNGTADEVATPYPQIGDTLSAADWNRAAAANNRVEVRWQSLR